jgi:hypothetical protein
LVPVILLFAIVCLFHSLCKGKSEEAVKPIPNEKDI